MKRRILTISVLALLAVALCGCSKQDESPDTSQNSEMNATEEVTEEILADAMDLSSYAEIPDNAIQEFWRWSEDKMSITYPEEENKPASYWGVERQLVDEYAAFLSEEMGLILQESGSDRYGISYGYTHPTIEAEGIKKAGGLSKEYPIVFRYGGSQNAVLYINEEAFTVRDLGYRRNGERRGQSVRRFGRSSFNQDLRWYIQNRRRPFTDQIE